MVTHRHTHLENRKIFSRREHVNKKDPGKKYVVDISSLFDAKAVYLSISKSMIAFFSYRLHSLSLCLFHLMDLNLLHTTTCAQHTHAQRKRAVCRFSERTPTRKNILKPTMMWKSAKQGSRNSEVVVPQP